MSDGSYPWARQADLQRRQKESSVIRAGIDQGLVDRPHRGMFVLDRRRCWQGDGCSLLISGMSACQAAKIRRWTHRWRALFFLALYEHLPRAALRDLVRLVRDLKFKVT